MSKVLVTGFGNFGEVTDNPSAALITLLAKKYPSDQVQTFIFKSYEHIDDTLVKLLDKVNPEVIIMFGLANKSDYVRLERVAYLPSKIKIGQDSFKSTLPLGQIHKVLTNNDTAVEFSDNAGDYWCNYLFYKVCALRQDNKNSKHGFIHIPNLNNYEQAYKRKLDLTILGSEVIDLLL